MMIELVYLDLRARGETIRMILRHAELDFVDTIVPWEHMNEMKKLSPTGQFPIVTVDKGDGTKDTFIESGAIIRFVGKLAGLYPEDPLKQLKQDQVIEIAQGLTDCNPILNYFDCDSPGFQDMYDNFFSKASTKASLLGEMLSKEGTPYYGGESPLVGDFHVWFLLDQMETLKPGSIAATPVLETFFKKLLADSKGLNEYLKERPKASEVGFPGKKNLGRTLGSNQYYKELEE